MGQFILYILLHAYRISLPYQVPFTLSLGCLGPCNILNTAGSLIFHFCRLSPTEVEVEMEVESDVIAPRHTFVCRAVNRLSLTQK